MRPDQIEKLTRHAGQLRHIMEQLSSAMHPRMSQERAEEIMMDLLAEDVLRPTIERCREIFRDVAHDRHNRGMPVQGTIDLHDAGDFKEDI